MDEVIVSRVRNNSGLVFQSLRKILQKQPEVRRVNLSRKRKNLGPQSSEPITLGIDLQNSSNQTSQGYRRNSLKLTIVIVSQSQPESMISNAPSTSTSTRRIVSNASIADPNQDSAGGGRVWASNEAASQTFADNFMTYVIGWIWPSRITLDWIRGREGHTTIAWSPSYPFPFFLRLFTLGLKKLFSR
jgi:hypothetical protein